MGSAVGKADLYSLYSRSRRLCLAYTCVYAFRAAGARSLTNTNSNQGPKISFSVPPLSRLFAQQQVSGRGSINGRPDRISPAQKHTGDRHANKHVVSDKTKEIAFYGFVSFRREIEHCASCIFWNRLTTLTTKSFVVWGDVCAVLYKG